MGSEAEVPNAVFLEAEVVAEFVAHRALDLGGEQLPVESEVPGQGVPVDDDPVLVVVSGDPVAVIHAVGVVLLTELGDDHRDLLDRRAELVGQIVDGVGDHRLEFSFRDLRAHAHILPTGRRRQYGALMAGRSAQ